MKHSLVTIFALLLLLPLAASNAADAPKRLRVFILAGQSNMEGQGMIAADPKRNEGKGSLEYLVKNSSTADRFKYLVDKDGKWIVRDDVWISYLDRKGSLTVGYGARQDRIGPELGFGWVMGGGPHDPVLLIKCAWGGKSLAVDFRPPSSGKIPYPLNPKRAAEIEKDPAMVGKYYRETLRLTRETLEKMKESFPALAGYEPALSGFAWHQGWNDRIDNQFNAEYEKNLANFIRDMRRDLKTPGLPFVIAETGMNGPTETHPRALSLMKAKAAVADYPEFKGNVAFVGTKAFWRSQEESPSGQGYHWNTNAETYYLIGTAMGEAMKKLSIPPH
jgi:alpha-galactosidase